MSSQRDRELPADRDDTLRRHRVGHRLEDVRCDQVRTLGERGMAFDRILGRIALDDEVGAEPKRLLDRLRALQQKEPGL